MASETGEGSEQGSYARPGWKRYLASYSANFSVIVAGFLCYHLCSRFLGQEAFELFAVCKRVLSYGIAVVASGLGVSLAYHVAHERAADTGEDGRYFHLALQQTLLLLGALFAISALIPGPAAKLLFGSANYSEIVLPLAVEFSSISLMALLSQYFIGRMQILAASAITVLGSAVIPVLGLVLVRDSLAHYFYLKASLLILVCVGFYLRYLVSDRRSFAFRSEEGRNFLRYAATRIPGTFLVAAILSLPVTIAGHLDGNLSKAAALSIGVALVNAVATGVTPLSSVFLPQAAFLKARDKASALHPTVVKVCWGVLVCIAVYVALLERFLEPFIEILLDRQLTGFEETIRWTLPAALPYGFFRCFQGLLDGALAKPLTTYNSLISILVFFATAGLAWLFGWGEEAVLGLLVGTSVLGGITVFQTLRLVAPVGTSGEEVGSA